MKRNLLIVLGMVFYIGACAKAPIQDPTPGPTALSKDVLHGLDHSVFEVVIPKQPDSFVKLEKPIPQDQIPFQIRTDHFQGVGTAFAVGPNRFLSAAHVFRVSVDSLWKDYYLRDRSGATFKVGNVVKFASDRDLIEFELVQPISDVKALPSNEHIEVGDVVFTAGNAQGEGISYRNGVVASFTPEMTDGKWKYIRFSAPTSPGNSGGPLIDSEGRVVGVVSMKNAAENLNYAVPISEYKALAEGKAHFLEKNRTLHAGDKSSVKTWEATLTLPQTREALSAEALASRTQAFGQAIQELRKESLAELSAPGFREYVTHQKFVRYFGILSSDGSDRNWKITEPSAKSVEIGPGQHAHMVFSKNAATAISIEKPKEVSLATFIDSPQMIMEAVLRATNESRVFGSEKIKVLSYGLPHEKQWWEDRLGRPWMRARWNFPAHDYYVEIDCTPIPAGPFCFTMRSSIGVRSEITDQSNQDQIERTLLGYRGTLKEWREFLSLKQEFLPDLFHGGSVTLNKGSLQVKVGALKAGFTEKSLDEDMARIHVTAGYESSVPPKLILLDLELVPREHNYLQMYSLFAPLEQSSRDHKETWKHLVEASGHFNGKIFQRNNYNRVMQVFGEHGSAMAHVVECSREESEPVDGLENMCAQFKKQLEIL